MGRMKEKGMAKQQKEEVIDWLSKKDTNSLPIWIKIKVPATKAEATKYLGKRCKEYCKGCATCDGWLSFDKAGTIPVLMVRKKLLLDESIS